MLHHDLKSLMSPKEIIDLAYADFQSLVGYKADLKITIGTDDQGKHLEVYVSERKYAKILRQNIPYTYCGLKTVVIFATLK